eukprot:m.68713 g.68713  ORF g.68713 m.68713 type:complete len:57 (+) comp16723_c0_seq4:194-364(+)
MKSRQHEKEMQHKNCKYSYYPDRGQPVNTVCFKGFAANVRHTMKAWVYRVVALYKT